MGYKTARHRKKLAIQSLVKSSLFVEPLDSKGRGKMATATMRSKFYSSQDAITDLKNSMQDSIDQALKNGPIKEIEVKEPPKEVTSLEIKRIQAIQHAKKHRKYFARYLYLKRPLTEEECDRILKMKQNYIQNKQWTEL